MKLTCDARALLGALDTCADVAPAKTTLPVLQSALLCAGADGTLSVTATDLTVQARLTTAATVDVPGSALIPVRRCAEWLDEVDDLGAPLELELGEDGRLHWRCGPYWLRILQPVDELPLMQVAEEQFGVSSLSAAALRSVLPALMAVAHGRDDRMHVGADWSIVSLYTVRPDQAVLAPLRATAPLEGDWCIPARVLPLLKSADGMLEIGIGHRLMRLAAPNVEVLALLDRSVKPVPSIMDLVEERCADDDFCVGRRELSRLLGAGELLSSSAQLSYQSDGQQLVIRGVRDNQSETQAAVDVVRPPAHDAAVSVNCQSLQRVLREIPGDPVGISISGDVLDGPGVRLWPYCELPDGALLLYGLRGLAVAAEGAAG